MATAGGIVVVEAGGNAGYDLDAYTDKSGKKIFDRRSADFREDSGAIMVGAAVLSNSPSIQPAQFLESWISYRLLCVGREHRNDNH